MKKILVIVAGAFVLFVGGLLALVFALTGGAVDAADDFLAHLGDGRTAEAYAATASALRQQQDETTFAAVVQELGLHQYASASWTSRSVKNDQATLEGSITTRDEGTIPLTMRLVKEDGSWKVLAVTGPLAGASIAGAETSLPAEAELQRLSNQTLLAFNDAVRARDFARFYGDVSTLLQRQTTPDALRSAFQSFIDQGVDIDPIRNQPAVFDRPPRVDERGVLMLSGHYPLQGMRVNFELEYVYEHSLWKLVGIAVSTV